MTLPSSQGWQLILADLALILFLVTLSALASGAKVTRIDSEESGSDPHVAPAQALFRVSADGPSLEQWLAERPRDPRATLTVFARHVPGERPAAIAQASALASQGDAAGYRVRVVLSEGRASDLHASLAYDEMAAR
ncbi:hypothetical protein [Qipengyuania nanhaisediminis]|uniref:hypothetical protein n=1 Tax=Qipengyuania nanhaisediminis TaxID=604088 RepID=UPI0038B28D11